MTSKVEDSYYDIIENIKKEVVYLLFQNREFLTNYNNVFLGKPMRKYIPLWVREAELARRLVI